MVSEDTGQHSGHAHTGGHRGALYSSLGWDLKQKIKHLVWFPVLSPGSLSFHNNEPC